MCEPSQSGDTVHFILKFHFLSQRVFLILLFLGGHWSEFDKPKPDVGDEAVEDDHGDEHKCASPNADEVQAQVVYDLLSRGQWAHSVFVLVRLTVKCKATQFVKSYSHIGILHKTEGIKPGKVICRHRIDQTERERESGIKRAT